MDRAIAVVADQLIDLKLFEGARLVEATVYTTPTRVTHGLGRKYRGFLIAGMSTAAIITDDRSGATDKHLTLTATVETACRLVVF